MQRRFFITLILLIFSSHLTGADLTLFRGELVNGRQTKEKLDNVKIGFYLNNELIGNEYTNTQGEFSLNLSTGIDRITHQNPDYQLFPNYPNPFSINTTITYSLKNNGNVSLTIFNVLGQKVRTIIDAFQTKGNHSFVWDGKDDSGNLCSKGIYFYHFQGDEFSEIRKMCFINSGVNRSGSGVANNFSLAKNSLNDILEIRISDRDVEDTTVVYEYAELPAEIDLSPIKIHVYPFARVRPDTLELMSGENGIDTLDIYFENPFYISSPHLNLAWEFTPDSLVAIHYYQVDRDNSLLTLKETDGLKTTYVPVYFELSPRLKLSKRQLRKGYIGIPYQDFIFVRNQRGEFQLELLSSLPPGIDYQENEFSGIPGGTFEGQLRFSLLDNRNIQVSDSAYLIIREPFDIPFNDYTVDILEQYPTDGTHPYKWVNTYTGVTRDLYYKGQRIAQANPDGSQSCYCCGLTFENFFRSIQLLFDDLDQTEDVNGMTFSDMKYFLYLWFVQSVNGDGPGIAMETFGIGDRIENWENVKQGDYLQFWRTSGSGHSVIFIEWIDSPLGDKIGIRYWSTQGSTSGIDYNNEYFEDSGGNIDPDYVYFSRIRSPENFTPFSRMGLWNYSAVTESLDLIVPKNYMKNE